MPFYRVLIFVSFRSDDAHVSKIRSYILKSNSSAGLFPGPCFALTGSLDLAYLSIFSTSWLLWFQVQRNDAQDGKMEVAHAHGGLFLSNAGQVRAVTH